MKSETPKYAEIHSSSCDRTIIGISNDFNILETVHDFLTVDFWGWMRDKMIGQYICCLFHVNFRLGKLARVASWILDMAQSANADKSEPYSASWIAYTDGPVCDSLIDYGSHFDQTVYQDIECRDSEFRVISVG
jgi:hypothetical protein